MNHKKLLSERLLYFPILFLLVVSFTKIANFDFFWHLAAGRYVIDNHELLKADIFSLNRTGYPWYNFHIVFQIIAYLFYLFFGYTGFSILKSILITSSVLLLFKDNLRKFSITDSLLLIIFTCLLSYRMMLRPEQLTIILLVFSLQTIVKKTGIFKKILLIFILQIIWTFSHSAFLILPVVLSVYLFSSLLSMDKEKIKAAMALLFVSLTALFLNPFGVEGVKFSFNLMFKVVPGGDLFKHHIYEFKAFSFNFFDLRSYAYIAAFIYCFTLIKRKKVFEFSLILVFILLGISAVRNFSLFLFVFFFFLLKERNILVLSILSKDRYKNIFTLFIAFVSIIFSLQFANGILYTQKSISAEFGSGISEDAFSEELTLFLKNIGKRKIFNSMSMGGYLIFTVPHLKVFYDGRLDLYGKDYFREYGKMVTDLQYFKERLNSEEIEMVILNYSIGEGYLLYDLINDKDWKLIFFDHKALVLGRRSLFKDYDEINVKFNRDAGT